MDTTHHCSTGIHSFRSNQAWACVAMTSSLPDKTQTTSDSDGTQCSCMPHHSVNCSKLPDELSGAWSKRHDLLHIALQRESVVQQTHTMKGTVTYCSICKLTFNCRYPVITNWPVYAPVIVLLWPAASKPSAQMYTMAGPYCSPKYCPAFSRPMSCKHSSEGQNTWRVSACNRGNLQQGVASSTSDRN